MSVISQEFKKLMSVILQVSAVEGCMSVKQGSTVLSNYNMLRPSLVHLAETGIIIIMHASFCKMYHAMIASAYK